MRKRRGAASDGLDTMSSATPSFFCRTRRRRGQRLQLAEGTSPRELRCFCADKAGKPSKASRGFCAFFMSATTLPLPIFRLTSLRVCAGTARLLFVLKESLSSLGYKLQFLSPTTRSYSRHQLIQVLRGGIAAIHSFPHIQALIFLFLKILAAPICML